MIFGILGFIAAGAAMPNSAILFSEGIVQLLQDTTSLLQVRRCALYYVALGGVCLVVSRGGGF